MNDRAAGTMLVRKFRAGEEIQLWNLFFHTVRTVNIQHDSLAGVVLVNFMMSKRLVPMFRV
jgi:hypothetical protein